MLEGPTLIAFASLLVTAILAATQIISWIKDQRSKRMAEMMREAGAEEQRDSIAVATSERAVLIVERALVKVEAEAVLARKEADELRVTVKVLERTVREQQRQIDDLTARLAVAERNSQ